MKYQRRFFQPRPSAADENDTGPPREPVVPQVTDPVSRARRTQIVFLALALLLTGGLLTLDAGATETYGFALLAVLSWIGLYMLEQDASLMRPAQRELQRQARTDGLTGLLNRRAFDEHIRVIWRHAEREKTSVGIVLLDVDRFKQLNDRHGHAAGDDVLRRLAGVLKTYASRPLDAVGRYGGDEFVLVWYDADTERFAALLKLLSAKLSTALEGQEAQSEGVTVSGGALICLPQAGLSIKDALIAADEQLYAAKRSCRGVICVDDSSHAETKAIKLSSVI